MENDGRDDDIRCIGCLFIWMDGVCPYCKLTGRDVEYEDTCKQARPVV